MDNIYEKVELVIEGRDDGKVDFLIYVEGDVKLQGHCKVEAIPRLLKIIDMTIHDVEDLK